MDNNNQFLSQFAVGDKVSFSTQDMTPYNGVVSVVSQVNDYVFYDITVGDQAHATQVFPGIDARWVVEQF